MLLFLNYFLTLQNYELRARNLHHYTKKVRQSEERLLTGF